MATFIYSPQIRAHIATAHDVFDVSDDISAATINRRMGVSSWSLTLSNRGRKYDGKFSPMDRISIYLKRVGPPLLIMSGYVDSAPAYSTYSQSVRLRGSCSLKRLQHWAWDPGSEAGARLMTDLTWVNPNTTSATDGGVAGRIVTVLGEVMNMPKSKIHIGAVPTSWFSILGEIGKGVIEEAEAAEMVSLVGNGALAGQSVRGPSTIPGIGPGTGYLPKQVVSLGTFGGSTGAPGNMNITREPMRLDDARRAEWGGKYYIQAPWGYLDEDGKKIDGVDVSAAVQWWRNRAILLSNPHNGKAVIARVSHRGSDVRVSKPTYEALGITGSQMVYMSFPQDPDTKNYGPVASTAQASASATTSGALAPLPGLNALTQVAQTVTSQTRGLKHPAGAIVVNTFAVLEDFLRWCVAQGIKPTEHPAYGGVHPTAHASIANYGFHYWPEPNGGGAADLVVPAGGEEMYRKLDMAALEASKRGLGVIWRAPNHWTHMHVALQNSREIGRLVYANDAELRALPPLRSIDGDPGSPGAGGGSTGGGIDSRALGEALFQTFEFVSEWGTTQSGRLGGKRALMNDVPLYGTIDELFKVGLRDWCSAPNGDIIGWFPDYFGKFGTAAKMVIEPIEVMGEGIEIEWSDERLKTHMFVTSASGRTGRLLSNPGMGSASGFTQMEMTAGIASVEFPKMMKSLFGITDHALYSDGAKGFLARFGARPDWQPMNIISGPRAEFFFSTYRFMKNWAEQYSTSVSLTFMPELYPGMIVAFPHWGIQGYVESVSHNVDMTTGFTTTVQVTAWSKIKGHRSVIRGLPEGGSL